MDDEKTSLSTKKPSVATTLKAKFRLAGFVHVYFARFATPPAREPGAGNGKPLLEDDPSDLPTVIVRARWRLPVRTGWLYVWLPGQKIWHEYQVTIGKEDDVRRHVKRVIWNELGKDVRPATGEAQTFVMLPRTKVQIAFSEIQWSWDRIEQLEADETMRAARMGTLDFSKDLPAGAPNDNEADLHAIDQLKDLALGLTDASISQISAEVKDKGLTAAVATLHDWLAKAYQRAGNYQAMWRLMEKRMAKLVKYAWYSPAALTVGVLARSKYDEDLAKQAKGIERSKLAHVLQSNERRAIREEIRERKNSLVDLLDGTDGKDALLGVSESIRDYMALPVEPAVKDGPVFADGFAVVENLIARLGDHEATLDLHLELNPVALARQADRGRALLAKIADPRSGHPLHDVVFPLAPPKGSTPLKNSPSAKMDRSALSLQVQRRLWETLFKFVSHFASLESWKQRTSVVELLVQAGVNMKTATITLGEFYGDLPKGDGTYKPPTLDQDDYRIQTTIKDDIAKNESPVKKKKTLYNHQGGYVDLSEAGVSKAHVRAYAVNTNGQKELVGAVSLADFKAGKGLGRSRWAKVRKKVTKPSAWRRVKVEVVVFTKPKKGFPRWVYDKPSAQMGLGAAFAVLEGWNLTESYKQFCAAEGRGERADWDFLCSLMDATSALAEIVTATHNHFVTKAATKRTFAKFVEVAGKQGFKAGAGVLGVAGGALSVTLSVMDVVKNWEEKDDAAIGHAILVAGFVLGAWSGAAAIGFVSAGPPGWVCALVLLIGAGVVCWFEDTPFEEWVALGPFGNSSPLLKADPSRAQMEKDRPSWNIPTAVAEALLDALYKPSLNVVLKPQSQEVLPSFGAIPVIVDIGNTVSVELMLPYFIDGTSLVYVELRWFESPAFSSDVLLYDELAVREIEDKGGQTVLLLDIPEKVRARHKQLRADRTSLRFKLEARVRVDVRGDGTTWIPRRSAATLNGGAVKSADWVIATAIDVVRE